MPWHGVTFLGTPTLRSSQMEADVPENADSGTGKPDTANHFLHPARKEKMLFQTLPGDKAPIPDKNTPLLRKDNNPFPLRPQRSGWLATFLFDKS